MQGGSSIAEDDSNASDFGTLLRRFRIEAGIGQEALAERAGVSVNAISALERGVRRAPHRDTVSLLIRGLEYTERNEYERALAALRDVLDPADLARLMDEGRRWSETDAIAEALRVS
jgi:transcriptional regulator with XRE-family HTH domain